MTRHTLENDFPYGDSRSFGLRNRRIRVGGHDFGWKPLRILEYGVYGVKGWGKFVWKIRGLPAFVRSDLLVGSLPWIFTVQRVKLCFCYAC